MYNIDDIYCVNFLQGYFTYVILSYDIHLAEVRNKSLLAEEEEASISLEVLKKTDHQFICKRPDAKYQELLNEMNKDKHSHLRLWNLWQPQLHYNSDEFLKGVKSGNN